MNNLAGRMRDVDRITIRVDLKCGPDSRAGVAYIDPRFYNGQAFVDAMACAVTVATEPVRRKLADMPEDELVEREYGKFRKLHAAARPDRELDADEMDDMAQCVYVYAGRGFDWVQRNVRNYTACDPSHYVGHEPLTMLQSGRRLAILNRVACVNPDDWRRPPLYMPTSYGVYLYAAQLRDKMRNDERPFNPPPWMGELEMKLHPHGMQGNFREAFNAARAKLKLEPWK